MPRACDGEDIYDMAWAPSGQHLIVGLTDNTASIWDMGAGRCIRLVKEHAHFVQGVAWDPHQVCFVTQSSDR